MRVHEANPVCKHLAGDVGLVKIQWFEKHWQTHRVIDHGATAERFAGLWQLGIVRKFHNRHPALSVLWMPCQRSSDVQAQVEDRVLTHQLGHVGGDSSARFDHRIHNPEKILVFEQE